MNSTPTLSEEAAASFAALALRGICTEYPNAPAVVLNGPQDLARPKALHPAFYGCFDWHSSVHSHWMLVHLLRRLPDLAGAPNIREALGEHFTRENLLVEAGYFDAANRRSFERTYGWAWLLKLAQELREFDDPDSREWSRNLEPLAGRIVKRYLEFLPRQTYPIRVGTHPNTAFGITFALDYARAVGNVSLSDLALERSRSYYGGDVDAPARWEPGGNDFFSPSLMEADLMRRVLPQSEFAAWLSRFLPGLGAGEPLTLFTPAIVADRTDPQIVHLDGLNLSRAWCMLGISSALAESSPARRLLTASAHLHLSTSLPHVASGDYMGEHWLATFAVYALSAAG